MSFHRDLVLADCFCHSVYKALGSLYNRLRVGFLRHYTDSNGLACAVNLVFDQLIGFRCHQFACFIVVGRSICLDGSFRCIRNAGVKTDDRDSLIHRRLNGTDASLRIQSCKTDRRRILGNGCIQVFYLLCDC